MSFDVFSEYATDETLENSGTWFPLKGGARLLIARHGNDAYNKMLAKGYEQNQTLFDMGGDAAEAKLKELMVEVMAETILLGWEDLSFKKVPMEYSLANARKLLGLKDFRKDVEAFSKQMTAYKVKQEAEQGESSSPS